MEKILSLFHHIHHNDNDHEVHHCGNQHVEINIKLDYSITHCTCGKHRIDKEIAIGHDFDMNEVYVKFSQKCPDDGWHIESGEIINFKEL